jgi:hypothetical protein
MRHLVWARGFVRVALLPLLFAVCAPDFVMAQASPFLTGASSLQTNILAWLTPVAIILIMVLGGMAMANRMSWGYCVARPAKAAARLVSHRNSSASAKSCAP